MRVRGNWRVQLPIVFGVIVASFVAAIALLEWQLVAVGRASLQIADNSAPSIEHLATARGEMRHLDALLQEALVDEKRAPQVEAARKRMDDALADYLVMPVDPGEQQLWGDILHSRDALNVAVDRSLSKIEQHDASAARDFAQQADVAADDLGAAITRDIELNASRSHSLALEIARIHDASRVAAFALTLLCAAIAAAGAIGLRRAMRQHSDLMEKHQALVEERASELEQFAGRIAHDILSPLSVVGLALQTGNPERGRSAIKRIDRLVKGLLAFAVAGARPDEDSRADVEATFADLAPELRAEAREAGAELEVSVEVTSPVACNPGVLTSVVSNLARNAIKYIGDGPKKQIEVRATETRDCIRIEVRDTGPGLVPELEPRVFEPYVRGARSTKDGIGLGLATVKRVAVAHGGRVGVKSAPGDGCTFWVELPRVRLATEASDPVRKGASSWHSAARSPFSSRT
jgi:signal transduction histidine kinase